VLQKSLEKYSTFFPEKKRSPDIAARTSNNPKKPNENWDEDSVIIFKPQ
jgi:hypothetical protein